MKDFSISPVRLINDVWRIRRLIYSLAKREVLGRYRGSFVGVFWSFLTPILLLTVFTFVFGEIFQTRWGDRDTAGSLDFAVALFAGLLIFNFFSESVARAPNLIISNANYVKKVVFPLEILTIVTILAALFHLMAGYLILLALMMLSNWQVSWAIFFVPFVFTPFLIMVLGFTWGLSALGVYLRDIGQLISPILTAMMFLSPIFYPLSSVNDKFLLIYHLNPLTFVIEQMRAVMLQGVQPNWIGLGFYTIISIIVGYLGFVIFQKTRKGFADVI